MVAICSFIEKILLLVQSSTDTKFYVVSFEIFSLVSQPHNSSPWSQVMYISFLCILLEIFSAFLKKHEIILFHVFLFIT